jgi:hypothetical protein
VTALLVACALLRQSVLSYTERLVDDTNLPNSAARRIIVASDRTHLIVKYSTNHQRCQVQPNRRCRTLHVGLGDDDRIPSRVWGQSRTPNGVGDSSHIRDRERQTAYTGRRLFPWCRGRSANQSSPEATRMRTSMAFWSRDPGVVILEVINGSRQASVSLDIGAGVVNNT